MSIIVVLVDKGKVVVVMDMVEYCEKVYILLSDENIYIKIIDKCRNLILWVEKDFNKLLLDIKLSFFIYD